jgi:PIN domain nuclease of toxin-antitoxin system
MSEVVLDASALLAILNEEPGTDKNGWFIPLSRTPREYVQ